MSRTKFKAFGNKVCKVGKKRLPAIIITGALMLAFTACGTAGETSSAETLVSEEEDYQKSGSGSYVVEDDKSLYEEQGTEIAVYYVTVGQGAEADSANHTWAEVNAHPLSWYEEQDVEPYVCEAVLQVGDENGPQEGEFGYSDRSANAFIGLKGAAASEKSQKSYKLTLKEGKGKLNGSKTVILNKYIMDPLRFTDVCLQQIMAGEDTMLGRRASLVHLYVKDKTEGGDGKFVDYGLYTQLENVNRTYLKSRGLDADGSLYKTVDFDFGRHEEIIREATDSRYDEAAFSQLLETKSDAEDHSALITMLTAVNSEETDTKTLVRKYFDETNLYYFMAFRLLTGDTEGAAGGYYLYSPQGTDKWYFISAETDHAFRSLYDRMKDPDYEEPWTQGRFMLTGNQLFRRVLEDESCRTALEDAMEDLQDTCLSQDEFSAAVSSWQKACADVLFEQPDSRFMRINQTQWRQLAASLSAGVNTYYEQYEASLSTPSPFKLNDTVIKDGKILCSWEASSLPGGQEISYRAELSHEPDFSVLLDLAETGNTQASFETDGTGEYFVRVTAIGADGSEMPAEGYYRTEKKVRINGVQCFYILGDGTLEISRFDQQE